MFNSNSKTGFILIIVAAFTFQMLGTPAVSGAGWHSKADRLPGYSTNEFVLKVVGIAAATALIIILLKNKKKDTESDNRDSTSVKSALTNSGKNCIAVNTDGKNLASDKKVKVGMYFDCRDNDENMPKANFNFPDKTVKVGFSLHF